MGITGSGATSLLPPLHTTAPLDGQFVVRGGVARAAGPSPRHGFRAAESPPQTERDSLQRQGR